MPLLGKNSCLDFSLVLLVMSFVCVMWPLIYYATIKKCEMSQANPTPVRT